ncbi:MAG: DUF6779 domain-containing protein, partial [Jatrophihabitantaceae bacterium]
MPSSQNGAEQRRRTVVVLRTAGFVAAVILGAIAVWLIVTSSSQKNIRIGVLTGLWGLLLGTYAMFGSRLPGHGAPEPDAGVAPHPGQELDLHRISEIERSAVAGARREFQQDLQALLHREIGPGYAGELASLRAEVGALRSELVEKVGGQLRLERIETTRLIGSDLEALQS